MKIGDDVYIHGYIDEIRKDTVIIKNEGGYFGTAPSEIKTIAQEPKVGHWRITNDGSYSKNAYICECSECSYKIWVCKDAARKWKYCPNCGAKMESEDQE